MSTTAFTTPLETFHAAMAAAGKEIRKDGRAQCPGHDGEGFNLTFKEGSDGVLLLTCHSRKCNVERICDGLNIETSDLFPKRNQQTPERKQQAKVPNAEPEVTNPAQEKGRLLPPNKKKKLHANAKKAAAAIVWSLKEKGILEKGRDPDSYYLYSDEERKVSDDTLFASLRWDLNEAEQKATGETKAFSQVSQVIGGWQAGNQYENRPLYGLYPKSIGFDELPNVVDADVIYVCEGEKAATALLQIGLNAVSPSQGANCPHKTDWSILNGKRIILLPDYDEAGELFARMVVNLITEQAPDATIEVKKFCDDSDFNINPKDDAADWSQFYDTQPPEWLRQRLEDLPNRVEQYRPAASKVAPPSLQEFTGKPAVDLWSKADEPIPWLVDDVFSADQPTIVGAKRKSLKTTLLTDLAVALSTGLPWLGHFNVPRKLKTLFVTGESNDRAAMRRICRAAKARGLGREDLGSLRVEAVHFPKLPKIDQIASMAESVEANNIDVVILDPLYRGMDGSVNASNVFEVGDLLGTFMEKMRPVPVIIAHHFRKNTEFRDGIPDLDDLSQAGIAEFAGNFWLIGRLSEYQGDGKHDLAVQYGGRDEQFGLIRIEFDERTWTAQVTDLKAHRDHQKQRKENEKVVQKMQEIISKLEIEPDKTLTASKLSGGHPERKAFQEAIQSLIGRETIELVPEYKQTRSKAATAYRLIDLSDAKTPVEDQQPLLI